MLDLCEGVLSRAAYIAPDMVLPVVQTRFDKAFEAVTATHLLVTGIHTMGLCIRPLLLAGTRSIALQTAEARDEDVTKIERFEAARGVVANAMMATLPGIDANDPAKTLACFRLYCGILSSVGGFAGLGQESHDFPSCPLPLYTEEWVDEFLVSILEIKVH